MKNQAQIHLLVMILLLSVGCTRDIDKPKSLAVSVPRVVKSQDVGAQAAADAILSFAVINLQIPGQSVPFVKEFDYHNSTTSITSSETLKLIVDNPPTGTDIMVQFLGVYEDQTNGAELFSYGDTLATIESGDTLAQITASFFGSSTKTGTFVGRLVSDQSSGDSGPTGTVVLQFQPPNSKPKMNLTTTEIWDGWMTGFLLDSTTANFTYSLLHTDQPLLENVNLSSGIFDVSSNPLHKVKFNRPQSYRLEYFDSNQKEVRAEVEEDIVIGFFDTLGFAPNFAAHKVCYPAASEAVMDMYADNTNYSPLIFNPAGTTGTHIVQVNGGNGVAFGDVHTTAACDPDLGQAIRVYPQEFNDQEGAIIGMRGPFQVMNWTEQHGGYVDLSYDSAANTILVDWRYMPGVLSHGAVTGAEVYYKQRTSFDGGGGGGDFEATCPERAVNNGFQLATTTSTDAYTFDGGGALTPSNKHDWEFIICPFKDLANGQRFYTHHEARGGCLEGCQQVDHTGWGATDGSITAATQFSGSGGLSATARMNGIDTLADPNHTILYNDGGTPFGPGNELLAVVTGARPGDGTECGTHNGQPISPGRHVFTRIVAEDTSMAPNKIYIPKGTFLDSVNPSADFLGSGSGGANFCNITLVRVQHYRNLTMSSTLDALNFGFNFDAGGFVALRVNQTLTFNAGAAINASGLGFNGQLGAGGTPTLFGNGIGGANVTVNTFTGGAPAHDSGSTAGSGGGGGWGDGSGGSSSGTNGAGGMGIQNSNGEFGFSFIMGGGGGQTTATGADSGGGGGIIFIVARDVVVNAPVTISANGLAGISSAGSYAGGGGGGSVILMADDISGASQITLEAIGGNGAGSLGGAGGGGFIKTLTCSDPSGLLGPLNNSMGAGGDGSGSSGNTDTVISTTDWEPELCKPF